MSINADTETICWVNQRGHERFVELHGDVQVAAHCATILAENRSDINTVTVTSVRNRTHLLLSICLLAMQTIRNDCKPLGSARFCGSTNDFRPCQHLEVQTVVFHSQCDWTRRRCISTAKNSLEHITVASFTYQKYCTQKQAAIENGASEVAYNRRRLE